MMLGDRIQHALSLLSITGERVEAWLGRPCHCEERREKLNQLDLWARRVVSGKLIQAREFLDRIVSS